MLVISFGWGQERKLAWHLVGEAAVPVYQVQRGFGGFLKTSYVTGTSGAVSFAAGVSGFRFSSIEEKNTVVRLVPFLMGYEWRLNRFYLFPQVGMGELGGKKDIGGDYARISVAAFFWAVGAGYQKNRFTAGLRFQSVKGIEGSDAGLWHNKTFHYTSVFAGYRLSR